MHTTRTLTTLAATGVLAAFAAQAHKGAHYEVPAAEPEFHRFTLTGGFTYLEPSMNGLDYLATSTYVNSPGNRNISTQTYQIDPDFDFGYFLGFGYQISDRYDIQASWSLLNTENKDSTSLIVGDNGVLAQASSGTTVTVLQEDDSLSAASTENLDYQMADATLGQYHVITDNLNARLFAGIYYAKIHSEVTNNYEIFRTPDTLLLGDETYDSEFWGVGPEVGFDLEYTIYEGFDVVGHFAAAFLVGELETETLSAYERASTTDVFIDGQTQSETRIVPALNSKLGLSYNRPMSDNKYRFGIEAGYQVAYYFNAVDQMQEDISEAINAAPITPSRPIVVRHNYSDVGFMGPYLNLSASF